MNRLAEIEHEIAQLGEEIDRIASRIGMNQSELLCSMVSLKMDTLLDVLPLLERRIVLRKKQFAINSHPNVLMFSRTRNESK